jgi:hypothetical protein
MWAIRDQLGQLIGSQNQVQDFTNKSHQTDVVTAIPPWVSEEKHIHKHQSQSQKRGNQLNTEYRVFDKEVDSNLLVWFEVVDISDHPEVDIEHQDYE